MSPPPAPLLTRWPSQLCSGQSTIGATLLAQLSPVTRGRNGARSLGRLRVALMQALFLESADACSWVALPSRGWTSSFLPGIGDDVDAALGDCWWFGRNWCRYVGRGVRYYGQVAGRWHFHDRWGGGFLWLQHLRILLRTSPQALMGSIGAVLAGEPGCLS